MSAVVSAVGESFAHTPLLGEDRAAAGIANRGRRQAADPLDAEMAKVLPQLAPCRYHADIVEEAHCKRPDGAMRCSAVLVAIADAELLLVANGKPDRCKDIVVAGVARGRADYQIGGLDLIRQMPWQHAIDLGEGIARGGAER